jgi:hypothetical protein
MRMERKSIAVTKVHRGGKPVYAVPVARHPASANEERGNRRTRKSKLQTPTGSVDCRKVGLFANLDILEGATK